MDIEHESLDNLLPPKHGGLHRVEGTVGGIFIRLRRPKDLRGRMVERVAVRSSYLNHILKPGEATLTWVGGKYGGIYIGFRKPQIEAMERLASEKFGMTARHTT